jgi:hypothetical protein
MQISSLISYHIANNRWRNTRMFHTFFTYKGHCTLCLNGCHYYLPKIQANLVSIFIQMHNFANGNILGLRYALFRQLLLLFQQGASSNLSINFYSGACHRAWESTRLLFALFKSGRYFFKRAYVNVTSAKPRQSLLHICLSYKNMSGHIFKLSRTEVITASTPRGSICYF